MTRMFPFITDTWNPLAGDCKHKCYDGKCWARAIAKRHGWAKYKGEPRIDEKQIKRKFKKDQFVFVQDMSDLFAENVPFGVVKRVLDQISESPEAMFLLLTKNPKGYVNFIDYIPINCVLGATIETNRILPFHGKAPNRQDRLNWMLYLQILMNMRQEKSQEVPHKLFVSIEPIMDFDYEEFKNFLCRWLRLWGVAIGYDNYNSGFKEPSLAKTKLLIDDLGFDRGYKVFKKTLREPNHE